MQKTNYTGLDEAGRLCSTNCGIMVDISPIRLTAQVESKRAPMKLRCRQLFHLGVSVAVLALLVAFADHEVWSQTARTIKIVVPYPPGAASDIMARMLGDHISQVQKVAVVIENRPGAGGTVGTEAAARAAPDGNTLLMVLNPFLIEPHVRKVSYDPFNNFEPVCFLVKTPSVLVVQSASPYRSLADLLDAARAKPGTLTLASSGPATATFLAFEKLKRAAKVDITFVPYAGIPPAINALLGNHVTSVFGVYTPSLELIKNGTLRALAVGSQKRAEALPEVPTIVEAGYKDIEADLWTWLLVPAKTPQETVSQLASWFKEALQVPEIKAKLIAQGLYPEGMCGSEFSAFARKEFEDYGRAIRESNIKIE
jgi:tripartite-type tricarboxylate transporter receptor subunit TctC